MRIISAALTALLFFTMAIGTAQARERDRGFSAGSSVFGLFGQSSRVRRQRVKRARLRRAKRARIQRRSATRRVVRRRKARRVASVRRTKRTSVRRKAVAKKRRASSRRKVSRKKVRSSKKSTASRFKRRTVRYNSSQRAGTIVVDTKTRHLYYVLGKGKAIRYGVAVGKEGFAWSGTSRVRRKVKWPTWTPPSEMIERKPELAEFKDGMPGGPKNPLGSRALYLFQGKKDTLYRIHGTNNPSSIGRAASSGCIRMRNDDVAHLYARVKMGSKVVVR